MFTAHVVRGRKQVQSVYTSWLNAVGRKRGRDGHKAHEVCGRGRVALGEKTTSIVTCWLGDNRWLGKEK